MIKHFIMHSFSASTMAFANAKVPCVYLTYCASPNPPKKSWGVPRQGREWLCRMSLEWGEWNVVVVGRWNRAILTPSGIAKRIFGLKEGTPVEVYVPIDAIGPYQVKYDSIVVTAGSDRLILQPDEATFDLLEKAKRHAVTAINELPETPFTAAGINIRYMTKDTLQPLVDFTAHESDSRLSDEGLNIVGRSNRRSVKWNDGQINISVNRQEDESYRIEFNFHRQSTEREELEAWLKTSIEELEAISNTLLKDYIRIDPEEDGDDGTEL